MKKIIKALEDSGILLKGSTKQLKPRQESKKAEF